MSDMKKHTLFLRDGDFDALQEHYNTSGFRASEIIRILVSNHVDQIQNSDEKNPPRVNVEIEI